MTRKIKSETITLRGGEAAILSTIEMAPGQFETMLASPDFGTEYAQLRTTSEAQALGDFRHLRKQYHVPPLSGKYAKLSEDLAAAAAYGLEVAAGSDDGGTCNMDAAGLVLSGWIEAKVEQAAKAAGVGCFVWRLWGSKSYVFPIPCGYQGNARSAAAEAMKNMLRDLGYETTMYYQMD